MDSFFDEFMFRRTRERRGFGSRRPTESSFPVESLSPSTANRSVSDREYSAAARRFELLRQWVNGGDETAIRIIELLKQHVGPRERQWIEWIAKTRFEGHSISNLIRFGSLDRVEQALRAEFEQ